MKDYLLTKYNINELFDLLNKEIEEEGSLLITSKNPSIGKWGMARLWRAWMSKTADWMAKKGATMPLCLNANGKHYGSRPFNSNDAHELFTAQWLGLDKDGFRLSWAKDGHDGMRTATKGERFIAMLRHEEWAIERGIILFKPRDSEFMRIQEENKELESEKQNDHQAQNES